MYRHIISTVTLAAFIITSGNSPAYDLTLPHLPPPGVMVYLSPEYTPSHLLGVTVHPENALQFDFFIHKGDQVLEGEQKKKEYKKLIKYFLASLTIPDEDQWVNLSPYEHDRIIKDDFGRTEMGRDLLAQDYMLKQITSSLIYPEDGLGKKFWDTIYARAWKEYHTTSIPVNTFNKVWIVPDQAIVYESGNTAYILKSHLKVMLEEDYLSLEKHSGSITARKISNDTHSIGSQVIREIILPELEREVNENKNFANLRQIYSGMILATWYKKALKESLLGKVYADKSKVKGVDQDPRANEAIYHRYLKAFKKGVFNYIKEDVNKYTNQRIPRKYFSGGLEDFAMTEKIAQNSDLNRARVLFIADPATISDLPPKWVGVNFDEDNIMDDVTINFKPFGDAAMEAGVKVDQHNRSLLGERDHPDPLRPWGMYYQIYLYHYLDTGNYTVGIHYNPTPSDPASKLKNEIEMTLGTQSEAVAKDIVNEGEFSIVMRLALLHFSDPDNTGDLDDIGLKLKGISERVKRGSENLSKTVNGDTAMAIRDRASLAKGGIDFNSNNLDMQIKRDSQGVSLPTVGQNMALLSLIQGIEAQIIEIKPAINVPIITELQQKLQPSSM